MKEEIQATGVAGFTLGCVILIGHGLFALCYTTLDSSHSPAISVFELRQWYRALCPIISKSDNCTVPKTGCRPLCSDAFSQSGYYTQSTCHSQGQSPSIPPLFKYKRNSGFQGERHHFSEMQESTFSREHHSCGCSVPQGRGVFLSWYTALFTSCLVHFVFICSLYAELLGCISSF